MTNLVSRTNRSLPVWPGNFFDDFFGEPFLALSPLRAMETDVGSLALDVSETDRDIVVRASLPGFRKDDVTVEVKGGVLTISAERDEESEEKNEKFHRRERRFGSVSRSLTLPAAVQDDRATAELKDGVLTLTLPKHEKAMPKKINVG